MGHCRRRRNSGDSETFDTRESANPPVLTIDYTPAGWLTTARQCRLAQSARQLAAYGVDLLASATITECRSGGAGGNYQVLVTFSRLSNSGRRVGRESQRLGDGNAERIGSSGYADLAQVANVQTAMITLMNVDDGATAGDVVIPFRVLVGDTTGNGSVTASDIGQVKGQSGAAVTSTNFRTDVTSNGGSINASDIGLVKSMSGTQLP